MSASGNRFKTLVLPHLDSGYNLARWLARDVADAEDIVQEACVRALKYIDTLEGEDARAWFLTTVRNTFYSWCRRNRPAALIDDDGTLIDEAIDPEDTNPETHAIRSAESRQLSSAIATLPLAFREALVLREVEGLSYKEIAQVMDIPIGTVMSRLTRARRLLLQMPILQVVGQQRTGGLE